MLTLNAHPNNILNRKIRVYTGYDNGLISEPHTVVGPIAQNLNTTTLIGGDKIIIPLSESLGEGGHFLKIHPPNTFENNQNEDSTLYITFCKKDSTYVDGYKDYVSNLPSAYINSLKFWVDNGQTPNTTGTARTRYLTFSAYGRESNQVENSRMFKVAFSYIGITGNDSETIQDVAVNIDGDVAVGIGNASSNGSQQVDNIR
mgnify:CR=1 FL=1|jgi:hypothetical protein|tara:strand:+ start:12663 stop:13268 length:606 start_codon:yes stop_codon:yes gene_type:complete